MLIERVKKTYSPPTDPLWDDQWYLVSHGLHDWMIHASTPLAKSNVDHGLS